MDQLTAPVPEMPTDAIAGVLAVQLGLATPAQINIARQIRGPDVALAATLEESGTLNSAQRSMLEAMSADALRAHEGDVDRALESIAGVGALQQTFGADATLDAPVAPTEEMAQVASESVVVTREQPGRYRRPGDETDDNELGRGGIGRVTVMHDEHLGRDVALKELLPDRRTFGRRDGTGSRTLAMTRFLREARITGQLEHPNIVPVYELGQRRDGTLYYTMKVVRGRTMADALNECRSLGDRMALMKHFVDLCHAVAYAHSREVVHRDLKPSNVMLGTFGETVVLDWGLAKPKDGSDLTAETSAERLSATQNDATETAVGAVLGTPLYMSPEQARGEIERIDARSDVWSLGAMLYELLTGQPPFGGRTAMLVMHNVATAPLTPVRAVCPDAPAELAAVAEKALSRDLDVRYANAKMLADEVQAYLMGGRVRAYDYGLRELVGRFARRHKVALGVAGVAAGMLLAMGVVAYVGVISERDRAKLAEVQARQARDEAEGLVRFLVGDLRERMEPLGRPDLLDGVITRVGQYFGESAASDDPEVDPARARNRATTLYLMARLHSDRGELEAAQKQAEEALALRTELARARPDDPEAAVDLARSALQMGAIRRLRGDRPAAEALTQRALDGLTPLTELPEPPADALLEGAEAHLARGDLLASAGDLPAAEREYRKALALRETLSGRDPRQLLWRFALAQAHDRLGNARFDQGDIDGAESSYRAALDIRRALVEARPGNLVWRQKLAASHDQLGDVFLERRDAEAAAAQYEESQAIMARAVRENPTNRFWQRNLAIGYVKAGDAERDRGRWPQAQAAYLEAQRVMRGLVEFDAQNAEWRRDLTIIDYRVGDALLADDRPADAMVAYERAIAAAKRNAERDPANVMGRYDIAVGVFKRADVEARRGERAAAAASYAEAETLLAGLVGQDPSNALFAHDLNAAKANRRTVIEGGDLIDASGASMLAGARGERPRMRGEPDAEAESPRPRVQMDAPAAAEEAPPPDSPRPRIQMAAPPAAAPPPPPPDSPRPPIRPSAAPAPAKPPTPRPPLRKREADDDAKDPLAPPDL